MAPVSLIVAVNPDTPSVDDAVHGTDVPDKDQIPVPLIALVKAPAELNDVKTVLNSPDAQVPLVCEMELVLSKLSCCVYVPPKAASIIGCIQDFVLLVIV